MAELLNVKHIRNSLSPKKSRKMKWASFIVIYIKIGKFVKPLLAHALPLLIIEVVWVEARVELFEESTGAVVIGMVGQQLFKVQEE